MSTELEMPVLAAGADNAAGDWRMNANTFTEVMTKHLALKFHIKPPRPRETPSKEYQELQTILPSIIGAIAPGGNEFPEHFRFDSPLDLEATKKMIEKTYYLVKAAHAHPEIDIKALVHYYVESYIEKDGDSKGTREYVSQYAVENKDGSASATITYDMLLDEAGKLEAHRGPKRGGHGE